jgi:hypothetical protein
MSDYIPDPNRYDPNRGYDKYGNSQYPQDDGGRGPYFLLALLIALGMIGGLMFFSGNKGGHNDVARAPDKVQSQLPVPALPGNAPSATGQKAPGALPMPPAQAPSQPKGPQE